MKQKESLKNSGIKNEKIRKTIRVCIFAAVFILAAAATVYIFPKILRLTDEAERILFEKKISELGLKGVVLMFLLQVIQVVLAAIPGEPVEVVMGLLYGTVPGCMICLGGVCAGTVIIYTCVKKFGRNFVDKFIGSDSFEKLKFLKNPQRRDILMFILFFIPGTPKDILVYFAPFTKIPISRLLAISLAGRIPSVISSTYVGANIAGGKIVISVIIYGIVGVLSLAGIIVYNKIIRNENRSEKN